MTCPRHHADPADLRPLLQALEAAMRAADLWQPQPPPADALASPLPFMVDTLRIEQWLQWVFFAALACLAGCASALARCLQRAPFGRT